jgi:26S proteasome regulatory subunit T1
MSPAQITDFLDGTIRNRISIRLIAEQHIALTHALKDPTPSSTRFGVVDMACSPTKMAQMCGSYVSELCEATLGAAPKVVVNGHPDVKFAYVP